MSKITQQFTFVTPYGGSATEKPTEIKVEGVGYKYSIDQSDGESPYDFDINTVLIDGQDCTKMFRLLQSDSDSLLDDYIDNATHEHMVYLFSADYETTSIDHTDITQD